MQKQASTDNDLPALVKKGVGLFGGSFDPVHWGHVRLAEEVQKNLNFDPLWIIPSQNPPHKPPFEIGTSHRLAMVETAFAHVPQTKISKYEIERKDYSFAIHTIEHFKQIYPDRPLFFILGMDAFYDLPKWFEFPRVLEECSYIIVSRAGWDFRTQSSPRLQARLADLVESGLLTKTKPVEPFKNAHQTRSGGFVVTLELELPEVSSTEVRMRLQLGESIESLVPAAIARYLKSLPAYGTKKA
ncbi:MAG: nicotinate (nicotinamide) nucleotide adenylyltransferase [Bdellovibrionota bacterium]